MDYGFWCRAKYIYLELLFDLAWESRRGSWARVARMRRFWSVINWPISDHWWPIFFSDGEKAPHSCHSSPWTPAIFPKRNAELQYAHMDYGFMHRWKIIFWHMIWMDGFWGCAKKQRGVIKKNSCGPLAAATEKADTEKAQPTHNTVRVPYRKPTYHV